MRTRVSTILRSFGLSVLVLTLCSCRQLPAPKGYAGTWVMTVGSRVFMVLTLEQREDVIGGSLSAPGKWSTRDGLTFTSVGGTVVTRPFARASREGGTLHLVLQNLQDKTDSDQFDVSKVDDDHLSVSYTGAPFPPWTFERSQDGIAIVHADWDTDATYRLEAPHLASSLEMRRIFDADQQARQSLDMSNAEWSAIEAQDAERRRQTRALLDSGQLRTPKDFVRAAFVFQHGSTPDDYLLAHTLALVAMAKGDAEGPWIAAATLDRYLRQIGQAQIYGTQFYAAGRSGTSTQGRFNRALVPDALRRDLGVPPLAQQAEQLKGMNQP